MPNDDRLTEVLDEEKQVLEDNQKMYEGMIDNSAKIYQEQINASEAWENKQTELQNAQTDFAIEQIEQQKEQEKKDYTKEQTGAYVDWQQESNRYGANAEQMAAGGLSNSGYSESSMVSMYNTYQKRVAAARESYRQAVVNYDNMIKEARLQNSSALAEIAYQGLQDRLSLALAGMQYQNQLLLDQSARQLEIKSMYHSQYQDVLNQINAEKSLAEQQRQFDLSLAEEQRQFDKQSGEGNEEDKYDLEGTIDEESSSIERDTTKEPLVPYSELTELLRNSGIKPTSIPLPSAALQGIEEAMQAGEKTKSWDKFWEKFTSATSTGKSNKEKTIDMNSKLTEPVINAKPIYKGNVSTEYYKGELNTDVNEFGAFKNGYQPAGITGHGYVHKTGETVRVETTTLAGQPRTVEQNVWETKDGIKWYWNSKENKYKRLE